MRLYTTPLDSGALLWQCISSTSGVAQIALPSSSSAVRVQILWLSKEMQGSLRCWALWVKD